MSRKPSSNSPQLNPYKFQKGTSGNPGGRSSAAAEMARRIREKTGDGLELIDFALAVLRGTGALPIPPDAPSDYVATPVPTDAKSRMFVLDWLSDRGWGQPKQDLDIVVGTVELGPEQEAMLGALHMSPHERRQRIAELRARLPALAAAAQDPVPDDDDTD